jgi:outer membrane protein TolC
MHDVFRRAVLISACVLLPITAFAQGAPAAQRQVTSPASGQPSITRQLSVDDAVRLALEQNLGIQIERFTPQIRDIAIAETRTAWAPNLTTNIMTTSTDTPATNLFAGGQTKVTDNRFQTSFGIRQLLPTGADYQLAWDNFRTTSSNFFNTFDPVLRSNVSFDITQPLLRNFKIDSVRQQLAFAQKDREVSDITLRATITQTTRNVKNAYWDLSFAVDNLAAQRQSLQLAQRLLGDNQKRVEIGTMAPIDIVEAQAEVARNEEAVIVAEAAIEQAQDRLRSLIFDPSAADFWTVAIEPTDSAPFQHQVIDPEGAVRRALDMRTDVQQAKRGLERNDINIKYLRNQVLPDFNANATYGLVGVGGTRYSLDNFSIGGDVTPIRTLLSQRGFGSVLGDVFSNAFPTWTFGVEIGYPIGRSQYEAGLARARLEQSQAQTSLRNLELQVATEIRNAARQVLTNDKRVASARAARELAERRLEAEEKKFAAGIQTSFFVFQAQRDLAQARTNEVRAISDYNKSQVDFEAVQEVPLR